MIDLKRVKRQIAWQHHRARTAGVVSTLSEEDWTTILIGCAGECFYCRKLIGENDLVIEHRSPIVKGGENTKLNVVAACRRCNFRKGNRYSPDVENILAHRINDEEILVQIGGHKIRMFDREVEMLISVLRQAFEGTT